MNHLQNRNSIKAPARPLRKRWNVEADKVLWKWVMANVDQGIKVLPVRPLSVEQDTVLCAWMFERGEDGTHVRATRCLNAIRRRALQRSKAGFKALAGSDAAGDLWRAIEATGGWKV